MEKSLTKANGETKTYVFGVVIEPDEERWFACCPVLEDKGAATWGYSREEALKNIETVVEMTVESMIEHGESIPEETDVQASSELWVAVTI